MDKATIKELLEAKLAEFNRPGFIPDDPIAVPHRFQEKEDIEIAGFLAATIAWGKRGLIVRSALKMMDLMGNAPYDFVMAARPDQLESLDGFVHRTFNAQDFKSLVLALREIYAHHGGLEQAMALDDSATDTLSGIERMRGICLASANWQSRTNKHIASPAAGSSAKRLNMFLRWMVRKDGAGVDFGLWQSLRPDQLVCPLDVHTGNVSRSLGLLQRKQDDWKAALELTEALKKLDPIDPVKYDFSLFGLGIFEGFA